MNLRPALLAIPLLLAAAAPISADSTPTSGPPGASQWLTGPAAIGATSLATLAPVLPAYRIVLDPGQPNQETFTVVDLRGNDIGLMTAPAAAGDTSISTEASPPSAGNWVLISLPDNPAAEPARVVDIAGDGPYQLTLDQPLAAAHDAGTPVSTGSFTTTVDHPTTRSHDAQTRTAQLAPAATPAASLAPAGGHIYYASSFRTARDIYCDTDPGWKVLSKAYLVSYNSLDEAMAALPGYVLRRPC